MTITAKTKYLGNLRTESVHVKSLNRVITDAPVDNKGKGEAFSPTDLLATSLAACMLTIMGIAADNAKLNIEGVECDVTKIMAANPRRVSEIVVVFNFAKNNFSEEEKKILRDAAHSCPVAQSLSKDLKQNITFNF
jgi:uncharacterized OsmC-like protein